MGDKRRTRVTQPQLSTAHPPELLQRFKCINTASPVLILPGQHPTDPPIPNPSPQKSFAALSASNLNMAACYGPLVMTPTPATPSPLQAPAVSTVGLLYDSITNRTFRIPDVPATSSVAHIKSWYTKNVGGA